jgi:6-phosphofructokinase 2
MVAGLVAGFSLHDTPEQILTLGLACGAGTVMHPGTELFDESDIECLSKQVVIQKLDI